MYHSTDLLALRGVAHLVVHGTSGSTSYDTIPHVQVDISGDVLSTADMVVQRRDGPRRLREIDDDERGGSQLVMRQTELLHASVRENLQQLKKRKVTFFDFEKKR